MGADILSAQTSVFVSGVALGALLLLAGVALGLWFGQRFGGSPKTRQIQREHVLEMIGGLFQWTNGFAGDMSDYRSEIEGLAERIHKVGHEPRGEQFETTQGLLNQLVKANDLLQERLEVAEDALKQQAEQLTEYLSEARTDALTCLPNRRAFDDELARRLAELRRYGSPVSVLLVDVDRFKKLNDQFGHLAGDAVLREVAQTLAATLRESDLLARFGGEEYAAILPATDAADASLAANRARLAVERAVFYYEQKPLKVTVSCGVAQAHSDEPAQSLLKRADTALYAAKNAGRNASHWHDGERIRPVPTLDAHQAADDEFVAAPADFSGVCDDLRNRLAEVTRR